MSKLRLGAQAFYFYFNCLMLVAVVGAFGINSIVNYEALPPISLIIVTHGILMTAWFLLVVVQSGLVRSNKVSTHKRLGKISVVLAIGVVISGLLTAYSGYVRKGEAVTVMASIVHVISFIIFYSLALFNLNDPAKHKRLMIFASLAMLIPALARITQALDIDPFASLGIWFLFMLAPLVHDIRVLKKVHRTTVLGIAVIIAGIVVMIGVGMSESWASFLEAAIGNG